MCGKDSSVIPFAHEQGGSIFFRKFCSSCELDSSRCADADLFHRGQNVFIVVGQFAAAFAEPIIGSRDQVIKQTGTIPWSAPIRFVIVIKAKEFTVLIERNVVYIAGPPQKISNSPPDAFIRAIVPRGEFVAPSGIPFASG